jgi:hypothetical protein
MTSIGAWLNFAWSMKDRPHLIYLATHGFAVRKIFQTGLLRRLTERGVQVSVIVPDASDPNVVELCARDGVRPIEYPAPSQPAQRILKSLRKYIVEDIRNNPCLWDKHEELKRGGGLRKELTSRFGLMLNDIVVFAPSLRRLFLRLEQRILLRHEALDFIRELKPDLLVSTYPVAAPEPELMLAARHLKVGTVLHLLSWDNITAKGHFQALADDYLAWGPTMKEELQEFYAVQEARITVCGVPHFDLYFNKDKPSVNSSLLDQLAEGRHPYLFFAMSAARYAPGETEILRQLCEETRAGGRLEGVRIVARPHPSALSGVLEDSKTLNTLKTLEKEAGLLVSYPLMVSGSKMNWSIRNSDMYELIGLLRGAAVVINSGSTVAVEALALGRPMVITSYDGPKTLPYDRSARRLKDYPHLRKLFADGGGEVVLNHEELMTIIMKFLETPDYHLERRQFALRRQIGDQDGNATEEVAKALLAFLTERQ